VVIVLIALTVVVGGCGGDDGDGGGDAPQVSEARAEGDVTWCIGKDTTGAFSTVVENFNRENPDANVELPSRPMSKGVSRSSGFALSPLRATCSGWTSSDGRARRSELALRVTDTAGDQPPESR